MLTHDVADGPVSRAANGLREFQIKNAQRIYHQSEGLIKDFHTCPYKLYAEFKLIGITSYRQSGKTTWAVSQLDDGVLVIVHNREFKFAQELYRRHGKPGYEPNIISIKAVKDLLNVLALKEIKSRDVLLPDHHLLLEKLRNVKWIIVDEARHQYLHLRHLVKFARAGGSTPDLFLIN